MNIVLSMIARPHIISTNTNNSEKGGEQKHNYLICLNYFVFNAVIKLLSSVINSAVLKSLY